MCLELVISVDIVKPGINVEKTATPTMIQSGEMVTWNITVENTGDTILKDINVTDTNIGTITTTLSLAPGEKWYHEYTTNPTDNVTNIVYANGTDSLGWKVSDSDTATVTIYIPPSLSITKSDSPDPVQPGEILTYTITVKNTGGSPAENVVVRENYDSNFIYASSNPLPDSGDNRWNLGTLSPGGSKTITITGTAAYNNETFLLNTATYTSSNAGSGRTTERTNVIYPSIGIRKEGPPSVEAGEDITYTITYFNPGDVPLSNVMIEESYPAHTTFVSSTPNPTMGDNIWAIGNLAPHTAGTLLITLSVDSPLVNGTALLNYIEITSDEGVSDNDTALTIVNSSPVLVVEKSDDPDPVKEGNTLNYTIRVTNTGNEDATNVVIIDDYNESVLEIRDSDGGADNGDVISWNIGTLHVGEIKFFNITAGVKVIGEDSLIYNFVNVTCDEGVNASDVETTNIETIPVLADPLLIITKEDDVDPVEPTYKLKYTLTVRNVGSGDATNVIITDELPDEVNYISSSVTPENIDGKIVTWNIGNLTSGDSFTLYVYVRVHYGLETGYVINNTANVTCDEGVRDDTWETTTITNEPPVTVKVFHGEVTNVYQTLWYYVLHYIPRNTTITLKATDYPIPGFSGVNHTYYRIWRWNDTSEEWEIIFDWREYYGEHIDLAQLGESHGYTATGKYEIEFYSIDRAGNREEMKWNDVYVYE